MKKVKVSKCYPEDGIHWNERASKTCVCGKYPNSFYLANKNNKPNYAYIVMFIFIGTCLFSIMFFMFAFSVIKLVK